jgi:hypothetical protein
VEVLEVVGAVVVGLSVATSSTGGKSAPPASISTKPPASAAPDIPLVVSRAQPTPPFKRPQTATPMTANPRRLSNPPSASTQANRSSRADLPAAVACSSPYRVVMADARQVLKPVANAKPSRLRWAPLRVTGGRSGLSGRHSQLSGQPCTSLLSGSGTQTDSGQEAT